MAEFMKDDFRAIYDNEAGPTRRAIISRGRKNAKFAGFGYADFDTGWLADHRGYSGWGDDVFGSQGIPVLVLATSDIFIGKKCYAVGFSDGSSITASEDHLWTTKHHNGKRRGEDRNNNNRPNCQISFISTTRPKT